MQYAKESVETKDLDRLFRAAHTIKGNSRIHNLRGLSSTVHVIENDIDNLRKSPDGKSVGKEALNSIYESLKVSVDEYLQLCKEIFGEDIDGSSESDLDDMIISKSLFMSSLEELKEISNEIGNDKISKILVKLEREEFKKYLGILHKTVDSISLSLTKNIELKIEGDDIYLDMTTASMIKDSLMHIIQNSADHGIQKEGVIKIVLKEVDGKMNIAVSEAKCLGIPTFGLVDTNTDPFCLDYPIPANDDSIKTIKLIISYIADSIYSSIEGKNKVSDESTLKENVTSEKEVSKDSIIENRSDSNNDKNSKIVISEEKSNIDSNSKE